MAEVGAAALSYAVTALLDEVLKSLKHVKNRSVKVLKLQNLLERLEPSVKHLCSSIQQEKDTAETWLIELHEQLEKCHVLVKASGKVNWNIFKSVTTSKESLKLYGSIYTLLQEASLQQWASGISLQSIFTENDAKILAKLRVVQERDERLVRRIADLSSKVDILCAISKLEQNQSPKILDGSSSAVSTEMPITDTASDIAEPVVTFGGKAVASGLISHILSSDCKKWVALYGMGGIGKTFTAKKVYHDSRIQRHFSGGMIWLTVSKDQPGPNYLFTQLLYEIEGRESVSHLPNDVEATKSYLQSKLDRERVLLVLDDMWQHEVLDYLDVIAENKESVILVTTHDQGILRKVVDLVKIFEIPRLSEEDSWTLFSYHAFRARGKVVSLEVDAVAKELAKECRGLPLALEVIGSTMADKVLLPADLALGQNMLCVWEIFLERLTNTGYGKNEYDALYLKLQLSFDSLVEQDSRLQDCFSYFAAFPEDEDVSVETLVKMWIAKGLVQDDVNSSFSAEEEGRVLLGFLVAKSMIEVTETPGGRRSCKSHDVDFESIIAEAINICA